MKKENNNWSNEFQEIKKETRQIDLNQTEKQQYQDQKEMYNWYKIKEQLLKGKKVILNG